MVRTMTDGVARRFHSRRSPSEREKDESQTEVIVTDVIEWLKDPKNLDLLRVDEKAPIDFVQREYPSDLPGIVSGEISARDKDGNEVGAILYSRNPCGVHLSLLTVNKEHRGKGFAAYLMREFINLQDKRCSAATLEPVPFGVFGPEVIGEEEWEKRRRFLDYFYSTFGFEAIPEGKMLRMPVCETRTEEDRFYEMCKDVDFEELSDLLEEATVVR